VLLATQLCGKHISAELNQHAKIEEAVFFCGSTLKLYNEEDGSNTSSTTALRVVGADENGTQCLGV
jgi:hypothetical protein